MKNKIKFTILSLALLFNWSCTDLEEQVLDESLTGSVSEDEIVTSVVAPVYSNLSTLFLHTHLFCLQIISSDEGILPARGGKDWYDGGVFYQLHEHECLPTNAKIRDTWNDLTLMLSRSVSAIATLTPLAKTDATAKTFLAEVRGMRAYYNMLMLDLWGIAFQKDDPNELSVVLRGGDAVEYIRDEFEAVIGDLKTDVGPGRLTQGGAYALLTRLYMNAAVWRDPYATSFDFTDADMDKVIEYSSKVINDYDYTMSSEYFACFDNDNHTNSELIFAIDQRPDLSTSHNRMCYWSMSGSFYGNPLYPDGDGTDGGAITQEFYQSWVDAYGDVDPADADCRFFWERLVIPEDSTISAEDFKLNRGIYRGLQYGLQNAGHKQPFFVDEEGEYYIGPVKDVRRAAADAYVDYLLEVDFTAEGSDYNRGYRVEKYEWSSVSTNGTNKGEHDLVIVRLADMYMLRAEAKLQKGDDSGALADVNFVRASRTARPEVTPPPLTELNLDILYRERGFEFYWEHQRRTDMIRFGKYEDPLIEKTNSDVEKRLFPIPQTAIDGTSIVEGYLVQNDGY
ncbi:RagB/SusD family nutrient uptake outer membrane protein [Maribellus maritimus]|uniref:RagB/SusD family nutrient uptake outer membrane protein n=1 Tax=Maribellus maritimus TaxID=2870838 RepID=UPI001EECB761|nr:RagB/SusD family nutrient uptake outer membrane protein [Maribellus maritimus]MCG6187285.1 RagB/SusD family nutrient uptake outer membrane protein [Maribellus maritimus]